MMLTLTGFDNESPIPALNYLCHICDIPLEIGILYYPKKFGQPRYPDIEHILGYAELPVKKALHICGNESCVEFIENEGWPFISWGFDRIQLNADWNTDLYTEFCDKIWRDPIILQINKRNNEVFGGLFPQSAHFLLDGSRGRGDISSRDWEYAPPSFTSIQFLGYAGGICPESLESDLEWLLRKHPHPDHIWVDIESGIRTDNKIDFLKISKILEIFEGMTS